MNAILENTASLSTPVRDGRTRARTTEPIPIPDTSLPLIVEAVVIEDVQAVGVEAGVGGTLFQGGAE